MSDVDQVASEKIRNLASIFSGPLDERVAILGAFDTWPYMDYVANLVAENNYAAITSRWIYRRFGKHILRFDIKEHPDFASNDLLSTLLDQVITNCNYAIINYSVSAAHFIETDWCYNKSKKTLGIAYVRSAFDHFESCCANLRSVATPFGEYSECVPSSKRTAWQCMRESGFCPFNKQDISKNVIEYFFRGDKMNLVAVENLRILPHIIKNKLSALASPSSNKMSTLSEEIIRFHESIFRKHAILVILLTHELLQKDVLGRASKMKLLALADTIPGLDINKIRQSRRIRTTPYMKAIKNGYVDSRNIADSYGEEWFDACIRELVRSGLLEQKVVEFMPNQDARLIKLGEKGIEFIDFLNDVL